MKNPLFAPLAAVALFAVACLPPPIAAVRDGNFVRLDFHIGGAARFTEIYRASDPNFSHTTKLAGLFMQPGPHAYYDQAPLDIGTYYYKVAFPDSGSQLLASITLAIPIESQSFQPDPLFDFPYIHGASWNDTVFGMAMSASGDRVAVAAPWQALDLDGNGVLSNLGGPYELSVGVVYVYEKDQAGIWELLDEVLPPEPGAFTRQNGLGQSAALVGDTLVASARTVDEMNYFTHYSGFHIYDRDPETGEFAEAATFVTNVSSQPPTLSFDGNTILAGQRETASPGIPTNQLSGSVFVYEKPAVEWELVQTLTPSDSEFVMFYGQEHVVHGDTIAVYAGKPIDPNETFFNFAVGAVYIYTKQADDWVETDFIVPPEAGIALSNSFQLALTDDFLFIGDLNRGTDVDHDGEIDCTFVPAFGGGSDFSECTGEISVYTRGPSGTWELHQTLLSTGDYAQQRFIGGDMVAEDGTLTFVSGLSTPDVLIYKNINGSWTERGRVKTELEHAENYTLTFFTLSYSSDNLFVADPFFENVPDTQRTGIVNAYDLF